MVHPLGGCPSPRGLTTGRDAIGSVAAMSGVAEVWRRPVGWLRTHPFGADALLAVLLTVLALVIHATSPQIDTDVPIREPSWWTPLLVVAATLPVMFRRTRPIIALLTITVAQLAGELLDIVGPSWLGFLVAIYSVGAHTGGRRRTTAIIGAGTAVGALLAIGAWLDDVTLIDAMVSGCIFSVAFVLGDNVRGRRLHVESLADRADRAEREREILARERVAEERSRIARELHDIVAHSVSVMVIQAAAARRNVTRRPQAAEDLLANIERTGRETMDELRQVLGVLRSADAEPLAMPVPTLADLSSLVDTTVGLPVRLAVTGDVDDVPAGVGVSVYRIVQEALTNANRHAGPGASVDVRVTCTPPTSTSGSTTTGAARRRRWRARGTASSG